MKCKKRKLRIILVLIYLFNSSVADDKKVTLYVKQLQQVKRLLAITTSTAEVVNVLGNEPVALFSVPTAIYCFLRGFGEIAGQQVRDILCGIFMDL